jgi:hypothetical protein
MEVTASVDASHDILVTQWGTLDSWCSCFSSIHQTEDCLHLCDATSAALFESLPYIMWFRDLLNELGYPQSGPTRIQDNRSKLTLYDGSGQPDTRKTRHYKNKIAFVKELVS